MLTILKGGMQRRLRVLDLWRGTLLEKTELNLLRLASAALAWRNGRDLPDRLPCRYRRCLIRLQRDVIHPNVSERGLKPQAARRPDSERRFVRDVKGLIQLIKKHLCFLRYPVQVNLHAGSFSLAVIGNQDMLPLV